MSGAAEDDSEMGKKKTAVEQVNADKQPKIVQPIPEGFPGWNSAPDASMVVSTPAEVNQIVGQVPEGKLVTLDTVRQHLARKYGTDIACPVTTAIFINVVARAAEEMRAEGETMITPYWRALKAGGWLNDKYPGGIEAQKALLEAEGFTITRAKKGYQVADYEAHLYALS